MIAPDHADVWAMTRTHPARPEETGSARKRRTARLPRQSSKLRLCQQLLGVLARGRLLTELLTEPAAPSSTCARRTDD